MVEDFIEVSLMEFLSRDVVSPPSENLLPPSNVIPRVFWVELFLFKNFYARSFHSQQSFSLSNRINNLIPVKRGVWSEFKIFTGLQFIFVVLSQEVISPVILIFRGWRFQISVPHWSTYCLSSTKDRMCQNNHSEVHCLLNSRLLMCFPVHYQTCIIMLHHYIASTKTRSISIVWSITI